MLNSGSASFHDRILCRQPKSNLDIYSTVVQSFYRCPLVHGMILIISCDGGGNLNVERIETLGEIAAIDVVDICALKRDRDVL